MTSWSRNNTTNTEALKEHVKLSNTQWATTPNGVERVGYDQGGDLKLVLGLHKELTNNDTFNAYRVTRRAIKTMFIPEILIKGEELPAYMCESNRIGALGLASQYDIFISFATKDEAALFNLTFNNGSVFRPSSD